MAKRHGELTRYLTFKLDKFVFFMVPHLRNVLEEIANSGSEGITFEDLLGRVCYKGGFMGPRLLRASLKHLFDHNYIITNHQIAKLREKYGIDAMQLRRYTS